MSPTETTDKDETVKRRSGWLIPLTVFIVTAGLSALFLLFYLAPAPTSFIEEHPSPTARDDAITLNVGKLSLIVPANFIVYRSARQGGDRKDLALFTTYPDFHGYTQGDAQAFTSNAADAPVIYMLIRKESVSITEAQRLKRIYMAYVTDPAGTPGPFGLTQYVFRDDSGYRGEDLFVGNQEGKPIVMRCVRFSQEVPSPSCLRDIRLIKGVALSYRFKRANLAHWQEIAEGVEGLIKSFEERAK
jgi:hypothetical protein